MNKIKLLSLLFAATLLIGCDPSKDEPNLQYKPSIYVVGYGGVNLYSMYVAKLWKNGVTQNLTDGTVFDTSANVYMTSSAEANSVFVSGDDIYVAGREQCNLRGDYIVKLWKNGEAQNFTDGFAGSSAISVFVSANDVYVAGVDGYIAKLWKNGIGQNLTDGTRYAAAISVFVSDNNVYVAGDEYNEQYICIAKLWKNGIAQNLTDGTRYAAATSVFVSDNNVYVAGNELNGQEGIWTAKLWKNGIAQNLTDGTHDAWANSVFVSGNNVYVAGYEDNEQGIHVATIWKNGVAHDLTDGKNNASAYSVYIFGVDLYATGYEIDATHPWFPSIGYCAIAKLWKNGVAQDLTDLNSYPYAVATSVFVK